jgi:hypothetical protein
VIEIHDPRREALSAVRAGPASQVAKKFERCGLAHFDPLDFFVAMFRVVRDVVEALVFWSPHGKQLEHMFAPCQ